MPGAPRSRSVGERKHRSYVSNHICHLPGFHGNSVEGRRFKTLVKDTLEAMGLSVKDEIDGVDRQ